MITLSGPTSVDIDAIDTDMNARAGDAELIPWLLFLNCAPRLSFFCARHRGGVLSRWALGTENDTDCLLPPRKTHVCSLSGPAATAGAADSSTPVDVSSLSLLWSSASGSITCTSGSLSVASA